MSSKRRIHDTNESSDKTELSLRNRKIRSWLLVIFLLGPFILNLFYAPTKNNWIKVISSIWLGIESGLIGLLLLIVPKSVYFWINRHFLLSSPLPEPSNWTLKARISLIISSLFLLSFGAILIISSIVVLYQYFLTGSGYP